MDHKPRSPIHDAPEAVPDQQRSTFSFIGFDDFQSYDPSPQSAYDRRPSPAPQYGHNDTSPRVSAQSPALTSDYGQSPGRSDSRFSHARTLSPLIMQSEENATMAPEVVYQDEGKEVVYTQQPYSKAPLYQGYPTPGIHHQNSGDRPQLWTPVRQEETEDDESDEKAQPKRPFYKRWMFILIAVTLIVFIAVGIALGVVFATRHSSNSGPSGNIGSNKVGVDVNTAVGGYINDAYYAKSGAFNGSGIAIAAANTDYDQSIYAFYQDYQGTIQYTLMDPQAKWSLVGPVNAGSYQALNGTPLSTVQHQLGDQLVWHLFYIDVDLILRERIITNTSTNGPSPIWADGPLNDLNLKAWNSTTIGFQACYWGNYYGQWSYDANQASAGIHLWYASDATTFKQYSWTNGSSNNAWSHDRDWADLSGNGGVGCQTWDTGMTEYVWFVDNSNSLAVYWQDNNKSAPATASHPVASWTKVDIGVNGVQKDSALGYTNYMIWQSEDTTIKGANITWGAENTKIASGDGVNGQDTWTLQYQNQDVESVRGTHLSITAVSTVSKGAMMLAFFQGFGDDVQMYTRDAFSSGALWQQAAQNPVESKVGV